MEDQRELTPSFEGLLKDFYHPNPNINNQASISMSKYWPEKSMDILIKNLQIKDIELRRKSVLALGNFGMEVLLPISRIFNSTDNEITKTSCLKILVKIASKRHFDNCPNELKDIIDQAIEEESPTLILTVISLLRQMDSFGIPYLKKLCMDHNILKARAAVTAVSELNDPGLRDFLIELVNDKSKDELIKQAAIDGLNNQ